MLWEDYRPVPSDGRLLSRNLIRNVWDWNELHIQSRGLFGYPIQLLLAVFGFVVFDSSIRVLMAELQHTLDESSESVCHGGDRFGCAEFGS